LRHIDIALNTLTKAQQNIANPGEEILNEISYVHSLITKQRPTQNG